MQCLNRPETMASLRLKLWGLVHCPLGAGNHIPVLGRPASALQINCLVISSTQEKILLKVLSILGGLNFKLISFTYSFTHLTYI